MDRVGIKLWAKEKHDRINGIFGKVFSYICGFTRTFFYCFITIFSNYDIGGSSYYDTFTFMI
ncbi:MAG: hypothetical protein ACLRQF_01180 [Thomasclavelia ramosa]